MEILKIGDTDLVHLLKQKLMIVLLYLDVIFVREMNDLFLHHLPREMSIPEHYHMKCTSAAKNRDGLLPRVMINMTRHYRSCLIPMREKENTFESCSTSKIKALCTLLTWKLQAVNPCTAHSPGYWRQACQHGQWLSPHKKGESHLWHLNIHLNSCQTLWSSVISVLIFIPIHLEKSDAIGSGTDCPWVCLPQGTAGFLPGYASASRLYLQQCWAKARAGTLTAALL